MFQDDPNGIVVVGAPDPEAHTSLIPALVAQEQRPAQVREASWVARAPELVLAASWRYRVQLAPMYGALGVWAGYALTDATLLPLGIGAGLAYRWRDRDFGERVHLSRRERLVSCTWLAAAAAAGLIGSVAGVGGWLRLGLIVAAVAWPSWQWIKGRRIRSTRMSKKARETLARWKHVSEKGPATLRGSTIVRGSAREPFPGDVTFVVLLAGSHAQDAVSDSNRKAIELTMRSGVDTVQLAVVRDDSAKMRVTIARERTLEKQPVAWDGPKLRRDGDRWVVDLAQEPSGKNVPVEYADKDGVRHMLITGTTGGGKSSTIAALLLAGPSAGLSTIFYIDGKRGTSGGYLEDAIDWFEPDDKRWGDVISCVHRIMLDRERRRGEQRLHAWRTGKEEDPVIERWVDERNSVLGYMSPADIKHVREIAQHGRALGIRLVQAGQAPNADMIIGGVVVRGLLASGGVMVGHRPIGSTATRLTCDSSSESIDLRALPPEPGFAGILQQGRVLTRCARVRYASAAAAGEWARKVTVRHLVGADLAAAGEDYLNRHQANHSDSVNAPVTQTPEDLASDAAVIECLTEYGPLQLRELDEKISFSRRTISNALTRLGDSGRVAKNGITYALTEGDE